MFCLSWETNEVVENLCTTGTQIPKSVEITTERQIRESKNVLVNHLEGVIVKGAEIASAEPIATSDIKKAKQDLSFIPEQLPSVPMEVILEPEPEVIGPLQCVGWFKDRIRLANELKRNLDRVVELPGLCSLGLSGRSVIGTIGVFFWHQSGNVITP